MLGQVVVDDQRMLAPVSKVFADGATGIGRQILHGRRVRRGGRDHHAAVHDPRVLQGFDHLGHGGSLLSDGHVDGDDARIPLVDDGVDGHGGLARLAVADDQLALSPADGNHGVDGLQPGLQRLGHRLAVHHAGRQPLDRHVGVGGDGPLAVLGPAQRVHDPPQHGLAGRYLHDAAGPLHQVALRDLVELAEEHRAHVVLLQIEGQTVNVVGKLHQLQGHHLVQPVDPGDAVPRRDDGPHLADHQSGAVVLNLTPDDLTDLVRLDRHVSCPLDLQLCRTRIRERWSVAEPVDSLQPANPG